MPSDLVGVAGFEPAASSSRSQRKMQAARAAGGVTWGRSSIGVRWRPRLTVAIVTHLVARVLVASVRPSACVRLHRPAAYKEALPVHVGPPRAT
jgi:hypothetical protein